MSFLHTSVLLNEAVEGLSIIPTGIYVDGTAGGGGHSLEIAKRLVDGQLYAMDQDPDAVQAATRQLEMFDCAKVIHADFSEIGQVLAAEHVRQIDGLLLDLGVSSHQLDTGARGFSYHIDASLDMRMSQTGLSAWDVVNQWSASEISKLLFEYGEEIYAHRIAHNLVKARSIQPIDTTKQLADIISRSVPARARREKNPAKRSFQAIRIAVNQELDKLSSTMDCAFDLLKSGGRMVIITFHSLEDRMVKQRYASWCKGCICPPDFPQCVCGNQPKAKLIVRKPITPSTQEIKSNRRSRTAKLRILQKI